MKSLSPEAKTTSNSIMAIAVLPEAPIRSQGLIVLGAVRTHNELFGPVSKNLQTVIKHLPRHSSETQRW